MNVLVVGSGAREHAISWKLRQSPRLNDLFVAPGNTGTAEIGTNLPIAAFDAIVSACREQRIDFVVVGNEDPLADGLVDRLAVEGVAAFGPARAAAEIESSKVFAKRLMEKYGIPTAPFAVFESYASAREYVSSREGSFALKPEGLTRGKGVIVTSTRDEALAALEAIMGRRQFGSAGDRVIIEQRLFGREVSAHAFTDGHTVAHLPFACDHKPIFDSDQGPNTGGMGAYSPPDWLDQATMGRIHREVTEAAVRAMAEEGRTYRGVLYPGLMIADSGPMVIEFNCRLGDPEAQVLLPRLESDLLDVLWASANDRLREIDLHWSDQACVSVVLASGGYPGAYKTEYEIYGIDDLDSDVMVFHAGTRRDGSRLLTASGRVLTLSVTGETLDEARDKAYRNVERIRFQGMHYRRDIGATAAGVRGA